jgi:hypothetical protein
MFRIKLHENHGVAELRHFKGEGTMETTSLRLPMREPEILALHMVCAGRMKEGEIASGGRSRQPLVFWRPLALLR